MMKFYFNLKHYTHIHNFYLGIVIPALARLKQYDHDIRASLNYTVIPVSLGYKLDIISKKQKQNKPHKFYLNPLQNDFSIFP